MSSSSALLLLPPGSSARALRLGSTAAPRRYRLLGALLCSWHLLETCSTSSCALPLQDEDEEVYKRDFSAPTLEDHFNKTILPKVMQVGARGGRQGRRCRVPGQGPRGPPSGCSAALPPAPRSRTSGARDGRSTRTW